MSENTLVPPVRASIPTKQNVCLRHTYPGSEGTEHDPPRVFENEITREDLEAESAHIKKMCDKGVKTAEVYKYLTDTGKRLGEKGKQMVSEEGVAQNALGYHRIHSGGMASSASHT